MEKQFFEKFIYRTTFHIGMKDFAKILFFVCWILSPQVSIAQENKDKNYHAFDLNYFYGTILEHNPDIGHLITDHPDGLILSYNEKTYGFEKWERRYNYPDFGYSFIYQDMKNFYLGEGYGLYAHMSFYFFNRHFMMRFGQGLGYLTKAYDQQENYINNAYGSHIVSTTYLMGNFKFNNIYEGLGLQAGFAIVHYSNGNFKAPNNSTNTFVFNVGVNYLLQHENLPEYIPEDESEKYSEPIHYNLALRSGVHSSDVIGMGQYPFLVVSAYADKRISYKSSFWAGTEIFFSRMLEELIYYRSVAFPEQNVSGDEDSKRVGVFGGYQLTFDKLSFFFNLGYYVYYPFDFQGRVYNRLGLQYAVTKDWFAAFSVHSHAAKAEAVEFSIGYRF